MDVSNRGISNTGTVLDRIVAHKLTDIEAAKRTTPPDALQTLLPTAPPLRDFTTALQRDHVALIAEVKKASPSKGVFLEDFDPVSIAGDYAANGAAAISVLTDEQFFQGHLNYLKQVRATTTIPLLRKEFILDSYQVLEARVAGADAILLIVACLEDGLLTDLYAATTDLGMAALVEVHTADELERALKLNPTIIGINNRNLHTFDVDLNTTVELAAQCPPAVTIVGESGIYTPEDVARLGEAGVQAILVGESLILADDRPGKIKALSGVAR